MHPIELFLKNFLKRAYNLESSSNKTEQQYTHRTIKQTGCITKPPHDLKNLYPHV